MRNWARTPRTPSSKSASASRATGRIAANNTTPRQGSIPPGRCFMFLAQLPDNLAKGACLRDRSWPPRGKAHQRPAQPAGPFRSGQAPPRARHEGGRKLFLAGRLVVLKHRFCGQQHVLAAMRTLNPDPARFRLRPFLPHVEHLQAVWTANPQGLRIIMHHRHHPLHCFDDSRHRQGGSAPRTAGPCGLCHPSSREPLSMQQNRRDAANATMPMRPHAATVTARRNALTLQQVRA